MSLLETLNQYSGVIALVGSLGGAAIAFFLKATVAQQLKGLVTAAELQEIKDDVEDHGIRVVKIEAALKHLPDAQVLQELALNVSDLRGELKAAGAELGGVKDLVETLTRKVEMMDGFLRNQSR